MNNPDLRRVIFSFFKNKNYAECMKCRKICRNNTKKTVNKYVEWSNFINCHACFSQGFLGHRRIFNQQLKIKKR